MDGTLKLFFLEQRIGCTPPWSEDLIFQTFNAPGLRAVLGRRMQSEPSPGNIQGTGWWVHQPGEGDLSRHHCRGPGHPAVLLTSLGVIKLQGPVTFMKMLIHLSVRGSLSFPSLYALAGFRHV